jgi:hypothetical protein
MLSEVSTGSPSGDQVAGGGALPEEWKAPPTRPSGLLSKTGLLSAAMTCRRRPFPTPPQSR